MPEDIPEHTIAIDAEPLLLTQILKRVGLTASTSEDGLTWAAPRTVVEEGRSSPRDVPLDKEWIACASDGR